MEQFVPALRDTRETQLTDALGAEGDKREVHPFKCNVWIRNEY